jgi:hypothetical protein
VVHRNRRRCHETNRRTDDRRHDLVGGARADHDAGNIRADEKEGTQEGTVEVFWDEELK